LVIIQTLQLSYCVFCLLGSVLQCPFWPTLKVEDKDIEERFSKYGKIVDIKLKKTGVNCFGFENHQDAEDAIKE